MAFFSFLVEQTEDLGLSSENDDGIKGFALWFLASGAILTQILEVGGGGDDASV